MRGEELSEQQLVVTPTEVSPRGKNRVPDSTWPNAALPTIQCSGTHNHPAPEAMIDLAALKQLGSRFMQKVAQISLFFSRHQKKLMINYSASPFAIPAVETTSVIYLEPTNSRGIKSQTHYGFAFPFKCLRAPGVYKIEVDKFSKKTVIFTFSGGSSANVASETSSLSCVTPGEQVSGGWWRRTVQSVLSSSSSAPPLDAP